MTACSLWSSVKVPIRERWRAMSCSRRSFLRIFQSAQFIHNQHILKDENSTFFKFKSSVESLTWAAADNSSQLYLFKSGWAQIHLLIFLFKPQSNRSFQKDNNSQSLSSIYYLQQTTETANSVIDEDSSSTAANSPAVEAARRAYSSISGHDTGSAIQSSAFVETTTLSNGVRVATETTPGHFSAVGVYIDAGSRFERNWVPGESGVSHLLDRLAFKVSRGGRGKSLVTVLHLRKGKS